MHERRKRRNLANHPESRSFRRKGLGERQETRDLANNTVAPNHRLWFSTDIGWDLSSVSNRLHTMGKLLGLPEPISSYA